MTTPTSRPPPPRPGRVWWFTAGVAVGATVCCWCGEEDDGHTPMIDGPRGPGHPGCLWDRHYFDKTMTARYGPGWNRGYPGLEDWTPSTPDPRGRTPSDTPDPDPTTP